MKILFSIIINALILFVIAYLLGPNIDKGLGNGVTVSGGLNTYLLGGLILGLINVTIKPILKIVSIPFFFLFFGLTVFIVNAVILKLFSYIINDVLVIKGMSYSIVGWTNFIIAVAIFTILNMVYSLLFFKK